MNIRKKSSLLLMAVAATPLVLGGADSGPKTGSQDPEVGQERDRSESSLLISGNCKVSMLTREKPDRAETSMVISSNSEASVVMLNCDRLSKLEVGASKTDPQKVELRLNFASGKKLTVDFQRHQAELITAQMSNDGAKDGPVQIHNKSFNFDFVGRDVAKAQAQGAHMQP